MSKKIYAVVLSALFIFSTSTFAEVSTTSSIRGVGNVSDAVVSATHTPTGQQNQNQLLMAVSTYQTY